MKKAPVILLLCMMLTMLAVPFGSAALNSGVSLTPGPSIIISPPIVRPIILAPSDLNAVASGSDIELNWSDNSSNETGFEVERKTANSLYVKLATVNAGITRLLDTDLNGGMQYTYRVRAINSSGASAYSNELTVTAPGTFFDPIAVKPGIPISLLPTAPGRLAAQAQSGTTVLVSWADTASNETGFKLERKEGNKSFAEIALLPKDSTNFQDTGLQQNTTYTYRARAFNNSGTSLYSNEGVVQTPTDIYAGPVQGLTKVIKYRIGQTTYTVNGTPFIMDVAPVIVNERTYLPIRFVAEPLGAVVEWDSALQKVTIILNATTVELVVNSNTAWVNGMPTPIADDPNVKPLLLNERVQVPVAFVAFSLGCDVAWDGSIQEVTLTYPKQ